MSGYYNYSMSNNAIDAYADGERPLSKWTKQDILDEAERIDETKLSLIKKVPLKILKDLLLFKSSWHHTSCHYNRTEFYSFDEEIYIALNQEKLQNYLNRVTPTPVVENNKHIGDIRYLVWSGTRRHPKATVCELKNVEIEEKGSFYIVYQDNKEVLRKKIGSNGTVVKYNK